MLHCSICLCPPIDGLPNRGVVKITQPLNNVIKIIRHFVGFAYKKFLPNVGVVGCNNKVAKGKMSLFRFLEDKSRREAWVRAIRRENLVRTPGYAKYILFLESHPVILTSQTMFQHDSTINQLQFSILFYYSFTVSSTEGLQQHVLQP